MKLKLLWSELCKFAIVAQESYIIIGPLVSFTFIFFLYLFYLYSYLFNRIIIFLANIALHESTYMSRQFDKNTGPAKAVDGLKTPTYSGHQCAISMGGQTALWWVDLGDLSSIHHITIYPRTENLSWGK